MNSLYSSVLKNIHLKKGRKERNILGLCTSEKTILYWSNSKLTAMECGIICFKNNCYNVVNVLLTQSFWLDSRD